MYKVEMTNNNKYELELKRANVVIGSGETVEPVWGTITGDITQQKDLQQELAGIKESIPDTTQINQDINHLKEEKADKSEIPDVSGLITKTELSSSLNGKADKANVYTKEEVDNKISISTGAVWGSITGTISQQKDLQQELTSIKESIPNLTEVQQDIANLETAKADKSEIPDITGLATKTELTDGLATKADTSFLLELATKQELESKADSADVYTKDEVNQKIDDAITGGEIDLSNYYTKAETYSRKEIDDKIPKLERKDF